MLHTSSRKPSVDYSIKISHRAKRARIEVSISGRVKVIVPKRFNTLLIPAFVAKHQDWLHKTIKSVQRHSNDKYQPPQQLELRALHQRWQVSYSEDPNAPAIRSNPRARHIMLNSTGSASIPLLTRWLHEYAREHLTRMLIEKSTQLALPFNKLRIKNQKTRWGSCSSKKNINLNRNLLFLPPELVDYLLTHELCHTIHLNHSDQYWKMVESCLADFRIYDKQLKNALHMIPAWALPAE